MSETSGSRVSGHYDSDTVGSRVGIPGAGLLAFVTRDQLHPPMVDDGAIWADGRRWYEGAVRHVLEAVALCELSPGQRVLDIGCGVGGPARAVADAFGVWVTGVNVSGLQVRTARALSRRAGETRTEFLLHDCREPLVTHLPFDAVMSINMIYHIADKVALFEVLRESLVPGGRLLVDDWMLTPDSTDADAAALGESFVSSTFARVDRMEDELRRAGFSVERFEDLGHVGRRHMKRHFRGQFLECFAPAIRKLEWGDEMVDQFVAAVELTVDLYCRRKLTYCRYAAVRS